MAAMFLTLNRNKRSLVLDLKTAAGKDVLWRLIDTADAFVHNMRPQKITALGLVTRLCGRATRFGLRRFNRFSRRRALFRAAGL